ncbi:MAG: hypothetical protein V7641_4189 [Blastocatellia bacterium]
MVKGEAALPNPVQDSLSQDIAADLTGEPLLDFSGRQVDVLLLPYLQAADAAESQQLAAKLISDHAEPIIKNIIGNKLRVYPAASSFHAQDAEDICSEVILEALTRLRELRTNPHSLAINNFCSYVAAITYRACSEYLRKKNPQRASLKNKLRYILTRSPGLALWQSGEGEWLCGLAAWRAEKHIRQPVQVQQWRDNPQRAEQDMFIEDDLLHKNPADLLAAIFNWLGSPIKFDDLICIVADLWKIRDSAGETAGAIEDTRDLHERLPDPRVNVATEVEQRLYLQHVWAEIGKLPLRQRIALLLNLTDPAGHSVIALLPIVGIASFREIAEAMQLSAEQLASLWNELPLGDAAIATHLGITRQQVINLRKSARERLVRRTAASGGSA